MPTGGSSGGGNLLATVPLGGLLAGVLRLAVPADRREEFLGDLIEEAHHRRARSGDPAMWLWTQVLRSLPSLLGLRLRGLAAGLWASPTPARSGAGVLLTARGSHRGWPLSLAVSVSAHALVVVAVLGWFVLARVEEVEPVRPPSPLDVLASIVGEATAEPQPEATAAMITGDDRPMPERRARTTRRSRPVAPQAPAAPVPGPELPGSTGAPTAALTAQPPAIAQGVGEIAGPVSLPPRIAEKRCLACPTPQLPPAYAHMAHGQHMLIRTCVNASGRVTSVNVLRGFDTTVNREVVATVRHWRMVPYQLDGHNVPFCYAARFNFTSS